ncbi:hypothetical protein ABIA39_005604 [Nocardia sp. GAS34]|uniref:hypothetical protein n=1 Tax=unclassified Nocardia TaxID=2637762 RepID=UPI003D1A3A8B
MASLYVLQLLLAAMFVVMLLAYRTAGPRAQRAVDAAAARQKVAPEVLAEHGVRLTEGRSAFFVGYAIAAALVVLGVLTLSGNELGRLPSWYRPATVARWLLATAGSVAVIVLLALPASDRYFS